MNYGLSTGIAIFQLTTNKEQGTTILLRSIHAVIRANF